MRKRKLIIWQITFWITIFLTILSLFTVPSNFQSYSFPKKLISCQNSQSAGHSFSDIDLGLDPIYIGSDNEFSQMASQINWLGDGSKDNPYVIKDLTLQSTEWETLIEIRDISVHFIITNCTITGGETGIILRNLANGIVENNTIKFSMEDGIRLDQVSNSRIKNNKIYNNSYNGIQLDSSIQNLITNNSVFHCMNGIRIESGSSSNNISQNIIYENIGHQGDGIQLYNAFNNRILNNLILNNENHALRLYYSTDNHISNNNISGNAEGIDLHDSYSNHIQGNQISNNLRGINLEWSSENIIVNNTLKNNGLVIGEGDFFTYTQTELVNNTVNDKPLIYWLNVSGGTVPNAGQIILLGCKNILISNQNIYSASIGILIYSGSNISIYNNILSNNSQNGLLARDLRNYTIASNNITYNGCGIDVGSFEGVKIVDNIIENNLEIGIRVENNIMGAVEHNEHGYQLIRNRKTWQEAKTDCEARGGHLVTITNQSENDFVTSLTAGYSVWIGLTDENTEDEWEWVTGEPVNYTNWASGEPNDLGGEDYTELYSSGEWNDLPEEHSQYYVCEWEVFSPSQTKTMIFRNIVKNNTNGIYLWNIQNLQITDNIIIKNSHIGLVIDGSSACNITSNKIINNGRGIRLERSYFNILVNNTLIGNGIIIRGWSSVHYKQVAVENNSINGKLLIYWYNISDEVITEAGQIILIECNNISIMNQNLSYASRGIFGYYCTEITITNCTLVNNSDYAIYFQYSGDCVISNNYLQLNRQAIQITDLQNFTVTKNTIMKNPDGGIVILWSFDSLNTECLITDNVVVNSSTGIDLWGLPFNSILNNTIINNSECGIRLFDTEENNIMDNTVLHNGGGIEVESWGKNIIINNTVIGYGFDIRGNDQSQVVKNNTVNGKPLIYWEDVTDRVVPKNAGQIFLIDVQSINVANVKINSVYRSITVQYSSDVIIQNSCFSNNSGTAIFLEGTIDSNIIGNEINQNEQGIEVHDSIFNLVENNTIRNNKRVGISLRESVENTILNNVIINNKEDGIAVGWNAPNTRIVDNVIHNNSGRGITVDESTYTFISNNTITNHPSDGVFLGWNSNLCTISNNYIAHNHEDGIKILWGSTNSLFENNFIFNNSKNGIRIDESSIALLSSNTIQDNYESGIFVEYSDNTRITGNIITNNCLSNPLIGAIQLQWSRQNTIQQNKLTNNGIAIVDTGIGDEMSSTGSSIEENIIENNTYGLYLASECTNTIIKNNDFISNLKILQILGLDYTLSQVYDNGTENTFLLNHYNDWVTPDEDFDGYVDLPYLINGTAQNQDPYPLVYPNPPRTHRIFGVKVIYPNGGENIRDNVIITWNQPLDSSNFPTYYLLYYSDNGGKDWTILEEASLNNIVIINDNPSALWNTSKCYDGSAYLVKVVAYAADGVSEEDTSDNTFSVINGITRPPPPQPPPPVALRILLFVIFCTILAGLIKRGYNKAS